MSIQDIPDFEKATAARRKAMRVLESREERKLRKLLEQWHESKTEKDLCEYLR